MPIINDCQQARSEITAFTKFNDNSFAYSTKYHGAKIITKEECGVQLSYKNENLNFNATAVCFSPDAKLIAFATSTHLHIANMQDKQIIKSIFLDKENLTILSFVSLFDLLSYIGGVMTILLWLISSTVLFIN